MLISMFNIQQIHFFLPDMRSVQGQLLTIFNVILTIIGAFVFGYKAIEYSAGHDRFILQISFGLICALIVAIADLGKLSFSHHPRQI